MDPQATLEEIARAIRHGSPGHASEMALTLLEWLERGGFAPDWNAEPEARDYMIEYVHGPVDEKFLDYARTADLPEGIFLPDDIEATGYDVAIIYAGAFEDNAVVYASFNDAAALARAIIETEQDPELEVSISDVSVGPGYFESRGYGPYGTFRWDPATESVTES